MLNRRDLPVDVRVEPTTDMVCAGGRLSGEACSAVRGSDTDVMTICGRLYLECRVSTAVRSEAKSVILTSESNLTHCMSVGDYGVITSGGGSAMTYSASNWLGSIRSARCTSPRYAGTTSSAT